MKVTSPVEPVVVGFVQSTGHPEVANLNSFPSMHQTITTS